MGDGQREWVVYLIGEKRLPAELQRGSSSHEQACLLSHQEATIRGAKLGQLPFVHMYEKKMNKTRSSDRTRARRVSGITHEEPSTPSLFSLPGKTAQRNLSFCRDTSHSTEPSSRLEHKKRVLITMQRGF